MFTIGVTSWGMSGIPFAQAVEKMVSFGAECTELNGRPGVHPDLDWDTDDDYQRVLRQLAEANIVATSLGGYCDFAQLDDNALEAEVAGLTVYCERAAHLGIPVVRAFAGDTKEGLSLADVKARITEAFTEVMRRVQGLDVIVGIENHGHLANDGMFLRKVIETVASPKLGMTIDTGNFYDVGHTPKQVDRFIQLLAPYVVNVHVKDVTCREGKIAFVPAGRGIVNVARLFALLEGVGYEAAIISEYEGEAAYDVGTRESVAYLRGLRDGR
jgi:L-ribulose-5-phosphate 3-epimerase